MKKLARKLRKRQSKAETLLWSVIRGPQLGYKFRRQHVLGPFIVDFICIEKRFVIELDGEHHDDQQADYDLNRQEWLESRGYIVARYWTRDFFKNFDEILEQIRSSLEALPSIRRHGAAGNDCNQ